MPTISDAGLSTADFDEVVRAVERLEVAANARMTQALQQSAQLVADRAKQDHGYTDRTGALTASVRAGQVRGTFASGLKVDMLAGARGVTYASHVEFGTKAHVIAARRRKSLRFVQGGQTRFAKKVRHPGTPEFRFMRNALEATLPRAEQLMDTAMELAIEESGLI